MKKAACKNAKGVRLSVTNNNVRGGDVGESEEQ